MFLDKLANNLSFNLLKPSNIIKIAERNKAYYWELRPSEVQNVRQNSLRKALMRETNKKKILKKILKKEPILANTW